MSQLKTFGRREPRPVDHRLGVRLRPETDVETSDGSCDGSWSALSEEPWLALAGPDPAPFAGHFVEMTYRASLWDQPVRPIFRFWRADRTFVEQIAPAPISGAATWIGRMPKGTVRVSVSPTNQPGPFGFAIEVLRRRSWLSVIRLGLRRNPRATRSALLTRLIGWSPESDVNLAWAIGAQPIGDYADWLKQRTRSADLDGLDRPRFDWTQGCSVAILVMGTGADADLHATLESLRTQVFAGWTAHVIGGFATPDADPRIVVVASSEIALRTVKGDDTWTCVLRAGDRLTPFALAGLIEQARRHPSARLVYGDTSYRDVGGAVRPLLEPGWSPRLWAASPDRAALDFVKGLGSFPPDVQRHFIAHAHLPAATLARLTGAQVWPLRRIVLARRVAMPPAALSSPALAPIAARAAIIVPTRDHPALLRRVVDSIRTHSAVGRYTIIVVDNGSVTAEAKTLLAELALDADVTCLDHPGPFDFSAMSNAGAAATDSDVLVFLNDDTVVLHDDWLDRLAAHAMDPGLGAIGAKLTYPDGRIQHIGVTIGLGGSAGHFGAPDAADAPGWAGRNRVPHEVSAVTGACLAVARAKFEAVGGFDAAHLPVELSDVDLCLKLNARGWQTLVDPGVHLMHEESVSRGGATFRRLAVYESQRAVFLDRWRHVLRDDPFFHPGLSLYGLRPALG